MIRAYFVEERLSLSVNVNVALLKIIEFLTFVREGMPRE